MDRTNKKQAALKVILAITIMFIMMLSLLLVQQYRQIQRLGYIHNHRQSLFSSLRGSGLLSAADASSTESWMTFDYIDRAFALPPMYLQISLGIADSRFPRMTVSEYASDQGLSSSEALIKVQNAILSYFPQK